MSDCAQEVTSNAVQIFGGYGYSKEYPVEKLMRDCKVLQIFEGANQVQRLTIAGVLNRESKGGFQHLLGPYPGPFGGIKKGEI